MEPNRLYGAISRYSIIQAEDGGDGDTVRFKAQVFSFGTFDSPSLFDSDPLQIDDKFAADIVNNFNKGTKGSPVSVVFGSHSRDVKDFIGKADKLYVEKGKANKAENGIWAEGNIDADEKKALRRIRQGFAAISPLWYGNYRSSRQTENRKASGPVLSHLAIVSEGHFEDMAHLQASKEGAKLPDNLIFEAESLTNLKGGNNLNDMEPKNIPVQAGDEPKPDETKTNENDQAPESKPEETPAPESKPDTPEVNPDDNPEGGDDSTEAGKVDMAQVQSDLKEARAELLTARAESLEASASKDFEDLMRKGIINRAQMDSCLEALRGDISKATLATLEAVRETHQRVLAAVSAGTPKVEFGEKGHNISQAETPAYDPKNVEGMTKEEADKVLAHRRELGEIKD